MGNYESITEKEKTMFQDVWVLIRTDLSGYGIALFNVCFTDYPLVANYFPFSGPEDDRFEVHTQKFMHEMDSWVKELWNLPTLKQKIVNLGISHAKFNIRPEDFDNMRACFIKAVGSKMGPNRFGGEQQNCFRKISKLAFNQLASSCASERVQNMTRKT